MLGAILCFPVAVFTKIVIYFIYFCVFIYSGVWFVTNLYLEFWLTPSCSLAGLSEMWCLESCQTNMVAEKFSSCLPVSCVGWPSQVISPRGPALCHPQIHHRLWPRLVALSLRSNIELHMRRTKLVHESIQTGKAGLTVEPNVELNWNLGRPARVICLLQTNRTCRSISTQSDEFTWLKRRIYHHLTEFTQFNSSTVKFHAWPGPDLLTNHFLKISYILWQHFYWISC